MTILVLVSVQCSFQLPVSTWGMSVFSCASCCIVVVHAILLVRLVVVLARAVAHGLATRWSSPFWPGLPRVAVASAPAHSLNPMIQLSLNILNYHEISLNLIRFI